MNEIKMIKRAVVELRIKFPNDLTFQCVPITFDEITSEIFNRLCPLHDIGFLPWEAARASKQIQDREALSNYIGKIFAHKILEEIKARDPVKGYSPEENKKFNQPTKAIASGRGA